MNAKIIIATFFPIVLKMIFTFFEPQIFGSNHLLFENLNLFLMLIFVSFFLVFVIRRFHLHIISAIYSITAIFLLVNDPNSILSSTFLFVVLSYITSFIIFQFIKYISIKDKEISRYYRL